jgi:hypothetical protein
LGSAQAKRFLRPHLNRKKLGMVVCTCHPSEDRKHKIGGSWFRLTWAKSKTISKITKAKGLEAQLTCLASLKY